MNASPLLCEFPQDIWERWYVFLLCGLFVEAEQCLKFEEKQQCFYQSPRRKVSCEKFSFNWELRISKKSLVKIWWFEKE
jgi:hypothetical protein